jgi:23S rRNA (pseudouridine1915-N3)-methyltransferase
MELCILFRPNSKNGDLGVFLIAMRSICRRFKRSGILQSMQITLAHIGARAGSRTTSKDEFDSLVRLYLGRCSGFARCQEQAFRTAEAFLEWLARQGGRAPVVAVLFDSRGKQMSSELFAAWLGQRRDDGTQHIVFAIGPADGWSDAARSNAQLLLSFGPMTLAHSLARVVAAEQIYRAFTILTGHPYHGGH